ncbi:hypothetical protein BMS3Abin07_00855 [bacterium BMS3Abin07]|nr:hypothetical protein BMS3Abin07_00855 [bacterium BMS3Abin07]GBE33046.1 hypothetical protein BMS3Bbin05_01978 [bacterium BMS3Bbin05]
MNELYNSSWLTTARETVTSDSWAYDVMEFIPGSGEVYLKTIQTWYEEYPNISEHLKNQLENLDTASHLGGVNELFWWELMKKFGWKAQPIKVGSERRPDFHITGPSEFFCEVTTLNISKSDRTALECENSVELDHEATIYRALRKIAEDKKEQIDYGLKKGGASILVLFDYTTWSGLATNFSQIFQQKLFEADNGFSKLPESLSAIVYIEKKIICARFRVSIERSAVFHNPYAEYPLSETVFFTMFCQHEKGREKVLPSTSIKLWEGWFCL